MSACRRPRSDWACRPFVHRSHAGHQPQVSMWRPCCCTGTLPLHWVACAVHRAAQCASLPLCIWLAAAVVQLCCLWLLHRLPVTGRACNLHAAPDSCLFAAHSCFVQQQLCPSPAGLLKAALTWLLLLNLLSPCAVGHPRRLCWQGWRCPALPFGRGCTASGEPPCMLLPACCADTASALQAPCCKCQACCVVRSAAAAA